MENVKVSKAAALKKLTDNRAAHHGIFTKAQEGFREDMIVELEKSLKDAREGKKIRRRIEMPEPINQTADYDRAIAMLEMSVDDEIMLSETDFACYILDQWHWRDQVMSTNSRYLK